MHTNKCTYNKHVCLVKRRVWSLHIATHWHTLPRATAASLPLLCSTTQQLTTAPVLRSRIFSVENFRRYGREPVILSVSDKLHCEVKINSQTHTKD